jgi:hypothetical protein
LDRDLGRIVFGRDSIDLLTLTVLYGAPAD